MSFTNIFKLDYPNIYNEIDRTRYNKIPQNQYPDHREIDQGYVWQLQVQKDVIFSRILIMIILYIIKLSLLIKKCGII